MFFRKPNSGFTAEIRVRRCYGCGAILQDQDPNEVGYTPHEKFISEDETLCERCYKLRHYSSYKKVSDFTVDYLTIFQKARENKALFVYVLNAFTLEASILTGLNKYLSKNVLVVINKRDILPRSYNDDFIIARAKELLAEEGIEPIDILLASYNNDKAIHNLMDKVNALRDNRSVYFFGAYQVGKSSLINSMLRCFVNNTDKTITTSPYPGTTLDVISIPLDENEYIYDTPGIAVSKSIISQVEPSLAKYLQPRNEIKVESYPAKADQSFIISNILRIDFEKGDKTTFSFFKSNDLTIERCKLGRAESTFNAICANPNYDNKTDRVTNMSNLIKHEFIAPEKGEARLIVYGLGFVDFMASGQKITVYTVKGVEVSLVENKAAVK